MILNILNIYGRIDIWIQIIKQRNVSKFLELNSRKIKVQNNWNFATTKMTLEDNRHSMELWIEMDFSHRIKIFDIRTHAIELNIQRTQK